jgi:hypothetical protein
MGEKDRLDQITGYVIGAAIEVHKTLGPGLLEFAVRGLPGIRTAKAASGYTKT